MHKEAFSKLMSRRKDVSIQAQLATQQERDIQLNRNMFLKVIESVLFLAHQGLPFRGHHDAGSSLEGNLL